MRYVLELNYHKMDDPCGYAVDRPDLSLYQLFLQAVKIILTSCDGPFYFRSTRQNALPRFTPFQKTYGYLVRRRLLLR